MTRARDTKLTIGDSTTAATTNVALAMRAMEKACNRPAHLPGLVGFYGPSGYGKSMAGAFCASHSNAYYYECRSWTTRRSFLEDLLHEMRIKPRGKIPEMGRQVADQLSLSGRPLVIDQVDCFLGQKGAEVIRDLHDLGGNCPILLIGEEHLEQSLRAYERFHNRVIEWVPALPATLEDARKLRGMYCTAAEVADDLLDRIIKVTRGITRRVCVNLERVQEFARVEGLDNVRLADWADRQIYVGEAPRRES